MPDDKAKKKADGKRVALSQDYEREYLISRVEAALAHMSLAVIQLEALAARVRTGFSSKKAKRDRK